MYVFFMLLFSAFVPVCIVIMCKNRWFQEGRGSGWSSCEDMVIRRIKESYPNNYEEVMERIIL